MQKYLKLAWEKTLPILKILFEIAKKAWGRLIPLAVALFALLASLYGSFLKSLKNSYVFLSSKYLLLYAENKTEALVLGYIVFMLLLFWCWMLWHSDTKETGWQKLWFWEVLFLGPLGALIYYVVRKQAKDREEKGDSLS